MGSSRGFLRFGDFISPVSAVIATHAEMTRARVQFISRKVALGASSQGNLRSVGLGTPSSARCDRGAAQPSPALRGEGEPEVACNGLPLQGPSARADGRDRSRRGNEMKAEFTAIIEAAPDGGFWAICPEVPGANGQGETVEQAKDDLKEAIESILEERRADILRGLPDDAIQDKVVIE